MYSYDKMRPKDDGDQREFVVVEVCWQQDGRVMKGMNIEDGNAMIQKREARPMRVGATDGDRWQKRGR